MSFLSRDPFTPRLIRAMGLKTLNLDMSSTLVPQLAAHDLEKGPWVPYRPFYIWGSQAASVGNFSTLWLFLDDGSQFVKASKDSRLVLDQVELLSGETSTTLLTAIGTATDMVSVANIAAAPLADGQDDNPACGTSSSAAISEIHVFKSTPNVQAVHNSWQIPVSANVAKVVNPYYPIAILRPGQCFVVANATANLALNVGFRGRFFIGQ